MTKFVQKKQHLHKGVLFGYLMNELRLNTNMKEGYFVTITMIYYIQNQN